MITGLHCYHEQLLAAAAAAAAYDGRRIVLYSAAINSCYTATIPLTASTAEACVRSVI